jgi:formate-dependent nitrite reductase membrane component NrfD
MGPDLHVASWPWYLVAVYFFLGGIAAGSYLLAAIGDIFGDEEDWPLVRIGHYIAVIAVIICPILLTLDLGQPFRFWRMLTRFKLLSPVSLGSWALFLFGLFAFISALIWLAKDDQLQQGPLSALRSVESPLLSLPRKIIAVIGGFFGLFVAGYTGVLLSTTANPFWNSNQLLGISFLVSALTAAVAVISLVLIWRGYGHLITRHHFRDLWLMMLGFEIFLVAWELFHEGGEMLLTGQYLFTFVIGVAIVGVLLPLILLAGHIGRRMSTGMIVLVAVLVLIGGFFFRYSVLIAGEEAVSGVEAALRYLLS